jgi:hypothetical protein
MIQVIKYMNSGVTVVEAGREVGTPPNYFFVWNSSIEHTPVPLSMEYS